MSAQAATGVRFCPSMVNLLVAGKWAGKQLLSA